MIKDDEKNVLDSIQLKLREQLNEFDPPQKEEGLS